MIYSPQPNARRERSIPPDDPLRRRVSPRDAAALLIRPTIAGLLIEAQFVAVVDPSPTPEWSFAETIECPCSEWSTALPPGSHCLSSELLVPLECGEPMFLKVYSEPADRMFPARDVVSVVGPFNPCDTDLDGMLTVADLNDPILYDWNQDGGVSAQDRLDFLTRFAASISLPRDAGGCP